jgi:hypothetical protein
MIKTRPLFLALALIASACAASYDHIPTKEEIRSLGKADQGVDYCERYGWYGDGICDPFCLEPDPDCAQPNNQCEAVGGQCIDGFIAACPGEGMIPSALSCGDHPIEMTCCEPDGTTGPVCPDICAALCAGEPEPDLPAGCPVPTCSCDE